MDCIAIWTWTCRGYAGGGSLCRSRAWRLMLSAGIMGSGSELANPEVRNVRG